MPNMIKTFNAPILKEFNDEERSITHFVSTESVDRDGDIVRADGIKTDAFMKNPVVLWRHDDYEPPIGKCAWTKVCMRDGVKGLLAKTIFANTDDAQEIYDLWKGGFLNAASIRFRPIKSVNLDANNPWGPKEFTECELLEYSIVPIPANGEALRLAAKGMRPETQLAIEKALGDEERVSVAAQLKALSEKLDAVLAKQAQPSTVPETQPEAAPNVDELKETTPKVEQSAPEPVETSAEPKAHDMKSVIAALVRGEVSVLKGA